MKRIEIVTRKDFNELIARIDKLEKAVSAQASTGKRKKTTFKKEDTPRTSRKTRKTTKAATAKKSVKAATAKKKTVTKKKPIKAATAKKTPRSKKYLTFKTNVTKTKELVNKIVELYNGRVPVNNGMLKKFYNATFLRNHLGIARSNGWVRYIGKNQYLPAPA